MTEGPMDTILHLAGNAAVMLAAAALHWTAMAVRLLLVRSGE